MKVGRVQKRSTIKDVAAEAAVSISTVSLVMNEKGNVSSETRARVLTVAERLGYVPTQAARQLVTRKTGNIGFVLRDDHFTRSEPFYTRIFLGSEFEARHHNLFVLLTTLPQEYHPGEHTPRFLRERNIDGIIVAGKVSPSFIEEVKGLALPIMLIDFEMEQIPAVVIDNQSGARTAVDHLIRRGHRRIAFLGTDLEHPSLKARLEGYRLALASAEISFEPDLLVLGEKEEPTYQSGAVLSDRLLSMRPMPTAVFCVNDALALGVLDRMRREGIAVPEKLAVVGFDDVPGAAMSVPPLTTVRVFKEQMGELALRSLVDLIEKQVDPYDRFERSGHSIKVTTELLVRASS